MEKFFQLDLCRVASMAVYFFSTLLLAGGILANSQFAFGLFDSSTVSEIFLYEDDYFGMEQTNLMVAAAEGDIAGIEQELQNGEDIHSKNAEGSDALMLAMLQAGNY